MSEQPSFVEGRGHLIKQPKPCKDCKKEFSMYESEIAFYKKLVESKGYRMPSRCADCRKKKAEAKIKGPVKLDMVANLVFKIAKNAEEGAYTFHEEVLAKELRIVGDWLVLYMKQNRMVVRDEQTESV